MGSLAALAALCSCWDWFLLLGRWPSYSTDIHLAKLQTVETDFYLVKFSGFVIQNSFVVLSIFVTSFYSAISTSEICDMNKCFWNFSEGFCSGLLVRNLATHFQFYVAFYSCSEDVSFFTGDQRRSLPSRVSGSCKGGFSLVVWGALHPAQTGLGKGGVQGR